MESRLPDIHLEQLFIFRELLRIAIGTLPLAFSIGQSVRDFLATCPPQELAEVLKDVAKLKQDSGPLDIDLFAKSSGLEDELNFLGQLKNPLKAIQMLIRSTATEGLKKTRHAKRTGQKLSFSNVSKKQRIQAISALAAMDGSLAILRAWAVYGQSLESLLAAGERGVDKGFIQALSVAPMLREYEPIRQRMALLLLIGQKRQHKKFLDAELKGPHKNIPPELNECRLALGMLRVAGLLDQLSPTVIHHFLQSELGIHTASNQRVGGDTFDSFKMFLRRWKRGLVQ